MSTSRVFTVGQVLTAAQMNDLPQGTLTSVSATADITGIAATETTVLIASAVTVAGSNRRLRLTFHCRGIDSTVANDTYTVRFKEGATQLGEGNYTAPGTNIQSIACDMTALVFPTAGSHTYSVTIQRAAGTGGLNFRASAAGPAHLIIEDVGI